MDMESVQGLQKTSYTSQLFRFAVFPNFDNGIAFLAEQLADKEEWDFSDALVKSNSILKNYLEFTFRRLQYEKKIAFTADNTWACFNTGLVTENLEDIYAIFEEYKNPKPEFNTPYCFKAFLKKSDAILLKYFSGNMPVCANYFDRPEFLVFNPNCDLVPDIDNIIKDNMARFPSSIQALSDSELRWQITGAVDEVKKRVKKNYLMAVPQFYDGKIQLLLPLYLSPGYAEASLALVAHRVTDRTYTTRTCLTLKMAYNNARLIAKPQSEWLKP